MTLSQHQAFSYILLNYTLGMSYLLWRGCQKLGSQIVALYLQVPDANCNPWSENHMHTLCMKILS